MSGADAAEPSCLPQNSAASTISTLSSDQLIRPPLGVDLEALPTPSILSRDEILGIEGHERVLLLALCDGVWVPLEPDRSAKHHSLGGMVASGYVLRPAKRLSAACSFRLEVPRQGDMTRVFLRSTHGMVDLDAKRPKYRDCPYLLFVGEVLCVRHLPAHAIATNKLARSKGAWELLELRLPFNAGGGDSESVTSETRVTRADSTVADMLEEASFQLHAGPSRRRVRYSAAKDCFVNTTRRGEAKDETWFAFAKVDWNLLEDRLDDDPDGDVSLAEHRVEDSNNAGEKRSTNGNSLGCTIMRTRTPLLMLTYLSIALSTFYVFGSVTIAMSTLVAIVLPLLVIRSLGRHSETVTVTSAKPNEDVLEELTLDDDANDNGGPVEQSAGAATADPTKPILEILKSEVTDEETGEMLSLEKVLRGRTRLETLTFRVSQPVKGLRRRTVTAKKFGFVYKNVGLDSIEFGDYEARDEPYSFDLPKQTVPSFVLAIGGYKMQIEYTADSHNEPLLSEDFTFNIV